MCIFVLFRHKSAAVLLHGVHRDDIMMNMSIYIDITHKDAHFIISNTDVICSDADRRMPNIRSKAIFILELEIAVH